MTASSPLPPEEGRLQGAHGIGLRSLWWPAADPIGGAVIVHGLGEHAAKYDHVARALNTVGLSVFAYDQRGHGKSDGRRGHADRFTDLLADLDRAVAAAEARFGSGPRFLVGHSLGGLVSLAWCQTRQPALAGLVLSAPWLATAMELPGWKLAAGAVATRLVPTLSMDAGHRPEHVTSDPELIEAFARDPLCHTRITARLFSEARAWQRQVRSAPDRLKMDCLFIVPGADPLADAEATRRFVAEMPPGQATVMALPGYRHEAFNELGRASVLSAVRDWVSAHLPEPGRDRGTGD